MKKIGGITKRWLKDIFSVIIVLVLSVSVAACLFIKAYYYTSIKNVLETNSGELITTFFNIYGANSEDGFAVAGREFIENCGMLDLMEIWIVDNSGNVIVSSSGFEVSAQPNMPDFIEAMNSPSGKATWIGTFGSGEKVMAMTESVLNTDGTAAGAIRYIVSLEDVDSQIGFSCLIIGLIAAVIIVVSTVLGLAFTRSIVRPLRNIGNVAGEVADGDLSVRIENYKYDDEIGELCGKINNMIEELNAADRLKNDFISTISHELRTPLTSIKGWGETLMQVGNTDPALTKRGMTVIIGEASRLSGMVEELLDFSKIQSNRMNLQLKR